VEVKVDRLVSEHLRNHSRSNPHTKLFLWFRSSKNICSSPPTASNVATIVQFGKKNNGRKYGVFGVRGFILRLMGELKQIKISDSKLLKFVKQSCALARKECNEYDLTTIPCF